MCKNRYKNSSASTLYLLRAVDSMVRQSHVNLDFFNPSLDLEIAVHGRYWVSPSWAFCPRSAV